MSVIHDAEEDEEYHGTCMKRVRRMEHDVNMCGQS